jgi:hypothetical protein
MRLPVELAEDATAQCSPCDFSRRHCGVLAPRTVTRGDSQAQSVPVGRRSTSLPLYPPLPASFSKSGSFFRQATHKCQGTRDPLSAAGSPRHPAPVHLAASVARRSHLAGISLIRISESARAERGRTRALAPRAACARSLRGQKRIAHDSQVCAGSPERANGERPSAPTLGAAR